MDAECLSDLEKEKIKDELHEAINTLKLGCEALDLDLAFSIFSNSPGFLMMGTDGLLCGYHEYLSNNIDYLTTCTKFKLTTFNEETRVLDRDTAVFAWAYRAEATLETGEQDVAEHAGASFVFRKVSDEWKVVYYHESSLPVTRVLKEH